MALDRNVSRRSLLRAMVGGIAAASALPLLAACGDDDDPTATSAPATTQPAAAVGRVTIYSGRNEELVGPTISAFQERTGIEARVRYAGTSELAAQILEEGRNSPADVYFSQDAGALGALAAEGLLAPLPEDLLGMVEPRFRAADGTWVGVTGRARAVVYNTDAVEESDIPESILGFTAPEWSGRLGWAPTNASLQSFVTALRVLNGDDEAREWLEGIRDNDAKVYESNTAIVNAVIAGEIDAGFVNHYYLRRMQAEAGGTLPAANFIYRNGDPGALINIAGAAILTSSAGMAAAESFIEYMLSDEGQTYFAEETYEYPLVTGVEVDPDLVPLDDIQTPDVDLSDLADLEGTLEMMRDAGLL
ncbi:MAG TPA: iron ABC transporter substrate-binding protein [Thermomicrobiales bacterium]|nr:iron ABC transporter substrate-binding protein [Thermomicrobiales bacterium]